MILLSYNVQSNWIVTPTKDNRLNKQLMEANFSEQEKNRLLELLHY